MDTKDNIKKEFMREYATTKFENITVKNICINTPVARTTFYSYYQNTDELKNEIEDDLIEGLVNVARELSGGNLSEMDFETFELNTMEYLRSNWDLFVAFMIKQPNLRFEDKWKNAIKKHFSQRYPGLKHTPNYGLITEVMASAVMGGYRYWMQNPNQMKDEEIIVLINNMLEHLVSQIK